MNKSGRMVVRVPAPSLYPFLLPEAETSDVEDSALVIKRGTF